ncbi:pilus assembly protein [Xanthomonas campestris pv. phormiicola]|nr:pilus assembly protein [Xanthomonas campestris pv. phormiicola]
MVTIPVSGAASQRGISLLVALILLLIMSLLAVAVLRSTSLEERMSANLLDRTRQFQAAESALRIAETAISAGVSVPSSGCTSGVCVAPLAGATDRWLDSGFSGWTTASNTGNTDTAITTSYIIEYMGDGAYGPNCTTSKSTASTDANCDMQRYRITARSTGSDRAAVILQTNYLVAK